MGEEHLTKFYKFRGEIRERYYVPPNPKQVFKEGNVFTINNSPTAQHHRVSGLKVKVLARYYTQNLGFKNYGMVVHVLSGPEKGKILHLPSFFHAQED